MEPTQLPSTNSIDVAKYFLYRASQDGELITPLKMQKLVYYAYAWTLVKNNQQLFTEKIQAWPNGPVVPSLYQALKGYGAAPISSDFLGIKSETESNELFEKFSPEIKATLDDVYEKYMTKTAFELVVLTHSEKPWNEAREGLSPTEQSNKTISDSAIWQQYGSQA
jgi:uncharacterized phage-associated protein